jgi:hypothetical protein
MLVNTQYFREQAIYYEKHGKYDCGIKGSTEYKRFYERERERCLYGYSVGGTWITGYHYYYLNYCPIQIVEKIGDTRAGIRKRKFPKFWDIDYMFFQCVHIAKYGTTIEELDALPYEIPLQRDEENLAGGHHLVFVKPRGIGQSYKSSSMASRNFHLYADSRTFMFAHDKEYLQKDGIYTKFLEYRSWVNNNAPFFKVSSDFKKDQSAMHYRASYDADGEGNEKGSMAEVIGVSVNGKSDKGRGKRGILLLFEEGGRFGKMDEVWNVARRSVEEYGVVYGTMIAFGTGGTEGSDFEPISKMFAAPRAYNVLAFNNIWDLGREGTDCGMFVPADSNVQMIDVDGNSDRVAGRKIIDEEIAKAELDPDPTLVLRTKAELPLCPKDAMLDTADHKFATPALIEWRDKLANNNYFKQFGTPVDYYVNDDGKMDAKRSEKKPITLFPHNKRLDLSGCPVEYTTPYADKDGNIPSNLYYICVDPFADDDAQDTTSLGSAYVIEAPNNFTSTRGDRIVAQYTARPKRTDDFNFVLFMMARRWNAQIGYESDRGNNILDYAKRFKLVDWLMEEFELAFDERIRTKNRSSLRYGMKIGSGKTNVRKLTGDQYLKDWLYQERGTKENSEIVYNFHYIYDIALLDELRLYDGEINVDRISSLRIGMFQQREVTYQDLAPKKPDIYSEFDQFIAAEFGDKYKLKPAVDEDVDQVSQDLEYLM